MRTALWVGGAILLAAVLFAPIVQGGYCADAVPGGVSRCETWSRSVFGIDSNGWLWLGATVVLVALALWWSLARVRRRKG